MSKEPAHRLIASRPVLEINRSCGMAKLVNCDTKASRFQYPLGDLLAEKELHLWLTTLAREEPRGVRAAQQRDELAPPHVKHGPTSCRGVTISNRRTLLYAQPAAKRPASPWARLELF